jgi:hypothetical protein
MQATHTHSSTAGTYMQLYSFQAVPYSCTAHAAPRRPQMHLLLIRLIWDDSQFEVLGCAGRNDLSELVE